jgi:hypothetical protein
MGDDHGSREEKAEGVEGIPGGTQRGAECEAIPDMDMEPSPSSGYRERAPVNGGHFMPEST